MKTFKKMSHGKYFWKYILRISAWFVCLQARRTAKWKLAETLALLSYQYVTPVVQELFEELKNTSLLKIKAFSSTNNDSNLNKLLFQ